MWRSGEGEDSQCNYWEHQCQESLVCLLFLPLSMKRLKFFLWEIIFFLWMDSKLSCALSTCMSVSSFGTPFQILSGQFFSVVTMKEVSFRGSDNNAIIVVVVVVF